MNRTEAIIFLERHGLPVWGTDEQLAERVKANQPAYQAPKPIAKPIPADGNVLLANRAETKPDVIVDTPQAVQITSENVHDVERTAMDAQAMYSERPTLTAFGPRKPGRPPKVQ